MQALPIDDVLPALVAGLRSRQNFVLRAETGAGKTTRVPPALLQQNLTDGLIVMLEPRRVAARAAARRMAQEGGWRLGREVGYQVRFDRRADRSTRILVVTEGILVRMLQGDPFLENVGVVLFDEFHERNLYSDLSLAMVRKLQRDARPDLHIGIMSATLEPQPLVDFLGGQEACSVVESSGRLFPVTVSYLDQPDQRGLPILVREGVERVLAECSGDVLVFLPGVGEIHRCHDVLSPVAERRGISLMNLFGDLSPERQDAVLQRGSRRKIVLATNVAETSITIDGVEAVVDSGLVRRLRFNPAHGLDRLELGRISKNSAEQRQGRAGRQAPGICLRLWTEHDQRSLPERDLPEIQRVDLAQAALELFDWGENDLKAFDWFEAPSASALDNACGLLEDLGAMAGGSLSAIGRRLAQLPVHPRLGRLLIAGTHSGYAREAACLAALLSERDLVYRPVSHRPVVARVTTPSDLLDRLDALEDFERSGYGETALGPVEPGRAKIALRAARQLEDSCRQLTSGDDEPSQDREEALLRSLLQAFPDRVAKRRQAGSRRALMVGGRGVRLAEMSSVHDAELFLCIEIDSGKGNDALVRQASAIDASWLEEQRSEAVAVFDPDKERVFGRLQTVYRDLVIEEKDTDPGAEAAAEVLTEAAAKDPMRALAPNETTQGFLTRLNCLASWMPELNLPRYGDSDLASLLPLLTAGRRSFAELRQAPLLDIVKGQLDYSQLQTIDRFAPERLEVPSGNHIRLRYEEGKPPILAARIQELFGMTTTPAVAGGKVPVLMHLLAPNRRPQQITQDLENFWRSTYPEVRKELQGRYPKHSWPEDPLTASAERRPQRRRKKS